MSRSPALRLVGFAHLGRLSTHDLRRRATPRLGFAHLADRSTVVHGAGTAARLMGLAPLTALVTQPLGGLGLAGSARLAPGRRGVSRSPARRLVGFAHLVALSTRGLPRRTTPRLVGFAHLGWLGTADHI